MTHRAVAVLGGDMRDAVMLEVELPQFGQFEEGLPLEDEEAIVAEVECLQDLAELPAVVGDVVHLVPRQPEVTQRRQTVKPS